MSWFGPALPEQTQDFAFGWPATDPLWDEFGTRRHAPAEMPFVEYNPTLGGWWQGGRKLHGFRPKKYWTRPHDGKRPGAIGRLKDALTGRGADVFITLSGDKRTLMQDCPQRFQWTNNGLSPQEVFDRWLDKDHRMQDEMGIENAPWTWNREGKRHYNFKTRRYEYPSPRMFDSNRFWADALWPPGAKHSSDNPLCKKDVWGVWETRVPWFAGLYPGGRPRPPV